MSFANGPAFASAGSPGRAVVSVASVLPTITLLLTLGSLPLPTLTLTTTG